MMLNNSNIPDLAGILYLLLGISNLTAGEYLAGVAWTSLSVSQFLVQKIGSWPSNMFRFERLEVVLAWITYLLFASLILHHLVNLITKSE